MKTKNKPKILVVNTNNKIMKKPQVKVWRLIHPDKTESLMTYNPTEFEEGYKSGCRNGYLLAVDDFIKDLNYIDQLSEENHVFIRLQKIKDKWELTINKKTQ